MERSILTPSNLRRMENHNRYGASESLSVVLLVRRIKKYLPLLIAHPTRRRGGAACIGLSNGTTFRVCCKHRRLQQDNQLPLKSEINKNQDLLDSRRTVPVFQRLML